MVSFLTRAFVFSVPVLLVAIGLFLVPFDKKFAYNFVIGDCEGRGKWIYDRLYLKDDPIDVAIVGTSVGVGLFDDQTISEQLTEQMGRPITVANLSYCRHGMNIRNLIIKELLTTKSPKHIVMEIRTHPNMGGHPMFGYLADNYHLFKPATRLYQSYGTDLFHGLTVRWEQLRKHLFSKTEYVEQGALFGFRPPNAVADLNKMNEVSAKNASKNPHPETTVQQHIHRYVYWENLKDIKELCDQHGVTLIFCYLNEIGRASDTPQNLDRLETFAPIWYPPDSVIQNPSNYCDPIHFNNDGARAFNPFLFGQLSTLYAAQPPAH